MIWEPFEHTTKGWVSPDGPHSWVLSVERAGFDQDGAQRYTWEVTLDSMQATGDVSDLAISQSRAVRVCALFQEFKAAEESADPPKGERSLLDDAYELLRERQFRSGGDRNDDEVCDWLHRCREYQGTLAFEARKDGGT